MINNGFKLIHPGEVLWTEFMKPNEISVPDLVKKSGLFTREITKIIIGNMNLTEDACVRLSKAFGNSKETWMNLQKNYDKSCELLEMFGKKEFKNNINVKTS